jgi:hypothetical protein
MHRLAQRDCLAEDKLWKIYWWGGHRDQRLVRAIERFPQLSTLPTTLAGTRVKWGRGFEVTRTGTPCNLRSKYRELPSKALRRYGPQDLSSLVDIPARLYRKGDERIYSGRRLLISRGIRRDGVIVSRFETRTYAVRNSIHGVRLEGFEPWQECVLTGILWSSLTRYYYFTTSGSWGLWHDEIHLEDVKQMPICLPSDSALRNRIVGIVHELQSLELEPGGMELAGVAAQRRLPRLERQLDDAIFELYELSAADRDLVREMCFVGLDLFYRHQKSDAVREVLEPQRRSGVLADLRQASDGLALYLRTFLETWNNELDPEGEFGWRVYSPPSGAPLLAVSFTTRYKVGPHPESHDSQSQGWKKLLAKLDRNALTRSDASSIWIDTFFQQVNDREILFIKRNERRFWTSTAAREDAESSLTHLMNVEEAVLELNDE